MKTHTEHIASGSHTYTIRMGGALDGTNTRDPAGYSAYGQAFEPNRSVRMENTGPESVVNPWIVVNNKRDWRSLRHILDEILEPGMADGEKARAIWEFARKHRYHFTPADDEVKDTVKMLNVYGYTLCWDEAYTVSNLWQAAGLKIRRGYPHGHCTTEVFYDGEYHLLDSDEHLLYLKRDNRSVAGEEDLSRDHDLVKRGHAYGILHGENRQTSQSAASLFFHTGPRTGGRPRIGAHRMDLVLRPGEALLWEWEDRGKYHGWWKRPPRLCNGRIQYAPALSGFNRWAESSENLISDGSVLRPEDPDREADLVLAIRSPYVIAGGKLELGLSGKSETGATIDVSPDGATWQERWTGGSTSGNPHTISLDPAFPPAMPASYTCYVRLRLRASTTAISHIFLETDLQMAPLSLPALELGNNQIRYTSSTEGPQQIRITHTWRESNVGQPPSPPAEPTFPASGARVSGTQFTFSWPPCENTGDYHLQLSDREDMRYVLSPTFEKLISRTPSKGKPEWSIPEPGLLNPGQIYFWRVRPRTPEGLWGAWSPTWSFTPDAPGVPLNVHTCADWETRTLALHWQPNPEGHPPVRYEIHASNERGFTASRECHTVVTGNKQTQTFPSNLLAATETTCLRVPGPNLPDAHAFYRVVAVDAAGNRSGPSAMAEAARPMIVSLPNGQAVAGSTYTYQIRATASIGELRCESRGTQRYVSAFRDADTLRFLLDEGPAWIHLHEQTGLLTARPQAEHIGTHTVTVRVQNGRGGVDMQGFDLRVFPPDNI